MLRVSEEAGKEDEDEVVPLLAFVVDDFFPSPVLFHQGNSAVGVRHLEAHCKKNWLDRRTPCAADVLAAV